MERIGIHKRLEPIFAGMNKTIFITSIVTAGIVHTLFTCNTLWLQFNKNKTDIVIGGDTYTVTAIDYNISITVTHPTITPTVTQFDIAPLFFFHGTIKATNSELALVPLSWEKLPLAYQHDPTKEDWDKDPLSSISLEAEIDIYFLAENDIQNWTNEDHENKAVTPMRNASVSFTNEMDARADLILPGYACRAINRVRWGTEETNGYAKQFFTENVSGIQMKLQCSFKKMDCEC